MLVGSGAIGREASRLLNAVDIEVTGAGSHARGGDADFGDVIDSSTLADHVGGYDWVIDIAPLTERTDRLIGSEVFAAMDDTAVFINVGRGDTVDTEDRKSTRLNSSHVAISYAVFCLQKTKLVE